MDIRLGNYGDSLRKIYKTLYENQSNSKSMDHTSFLQRIDELTLDDTIDDPVNPSRSCEETSFFEVLDEVNSSIACMPDKFIVGSNKRVQILTSRPRTQRIVHGLMFLRRPFPHNRQNLPLWAISPAHLERILFFLGLKILL